MENRIKQLEQQIKELQNRKPFQFISRKEKTPIPMFYQKIVKSHTDFQNVATTKDVELFKLPSGGEIISCFMNVDTAFIGTTSYTISVGNIQHIYKWH